MVCAMTLLAAGDVSGHINLFKLIPVVLLLLVWAKLLTWMDKDAPAAHLPREYLNTGILLGGFLGFVLFLLVPGFIVAYLALFFCLAGGFGVYLIMRNSKVGLGDLKKELAAWRKNLFKGKAKKEEAPPGQVQVFTKSGNPMPIPESDDPGRPAYDAVQKLLTDPLKKNAERVDMKPTDGAVGVSVTIDGVTYSAASMERNAATAAVTYLKKAAALDMEEKRRPQTGVVKSVMDGTRRELEVTTAGTTAGEFLRVQVDAKKRHGRRLAELGFMPDQLTAVTDMVRDGQGVVLVAAPREQGLTTLLYALLREHDAFLTHIQSIERNAEADLEGITQTHLPVKATPAEELKQVEWIISQQPDTILVDQVINPSSARELVKFTRDNKRVYIGMRAANTFDALAQWRKLVGDDALAMKDLRMIVAGRVARRLCTACKVASPADPETLRKLNLDPAKVTQLFSARTQPIRNKKGEPVPCNFCQELRFKGRFGIFEVMRIEDGFRQAVLTGANENNLKKEFRKLKGLFLQETALQQVVAGETSIQEVLRVIRLGNEPQSAAGAA